MSELLTRSEQRYKSAMSQYKKALELGMYCLKFNISKVALHALATDERLKEEKERQALMAGR